MSKDVIKEFNYIISFISPRIRSLLKDLNEQLIVELQEIRMRANRPVVLVTRSGSSFLTQNSKSTLILSGNCVTATENEIVDTVNKMCGYSMHSHFEDILNGYITLPNGARVGLCGTAVYDKTEVKSLKDISSLNIRIPRFEKGCSDALFDSVFSDGIESLIIAGAPSSGKTTLLKDIAYQLSSGRTGKYYKVCVVDERKELFPAKNSTADLGPNTDVIYGFPKQTGISIAVRTMSPDIIICDEIGNTEEAVQIFEGLNSGVRFLLSVHCDSLEELRNKKFIKMLLKSGGFNRVAILCGSYAPCKIERIVNSDAVLYEKHSDSYAFGDRGLFGNTVRKAN